MVIRLPPTVPIDPSPQHPNSPDKQASEVVTKQVQKSGTVAKIVRTTLEYQQKEQYYVRSSVIPCFIIHGKACLGHAVLLTVIPADGPLHMAYAKFDRHRSASQGYGSAQAGLEETKAYGPKTTSIL